MPAFNDEHACQPAGWLDITAAMTSPASEIPSIAREWPDAIRKREEALAAARQLLADTAEAVGPDMAAPDLLSCLTRYRARLATLVAVGSTRPARDPAMATTLHPATSWPGCPAQHGRGTDLRRAVFTFAAEDGQTGPDGQHQITEIWAFFRQPGEEHDDDILETGCLDVPAGSPIANLARRVAVSPGMARKVEGILRASIAACPCHRQPVPCHLRDADAECPALSTLRRLEAIEHATR